MVVSAVTGTTPTTSGSAAPLTSSKGLADNFQTFLTLLTTQLKNQNPLEPLDTNQFTQQLVQFAQVEQQLKTNDSLTNLIDIQKNANITTAASFLGATVTVDGQTAPLKNGAAAWDFTMPEAGNATIDIKNATGVSVYSMNANAQQGQQTFKWDGRGPNGTLFPDGDYTISVTAKDANAQPIAVSTEVHGVVDGVDLTQNPPLLKVGSNSYALNKVKGLRRTGV